ncbi:MAG: hypothetical protein QOE61_2814, partial [Micromonosporaceae bacterium]|nr:hypothetical protein [Micromonosporaceae bacterium]
FAEAGGGPGSSGGGLAARMTRAKGWTAESYARAADAHPGTPERDDLVSALTTTFFSGAVRSGDYLDLDTGLAVITRHAKALGYDVMVFFLDELILWLSTRISDHAFVNTEGAKLNKLVESADAHRPLPIVSFVARQRNIEDFLGPQVGGTEREALAHVMRSVQGRLGEIVLADTNLPEITERRLLKPVSDDARRTIDAAFLAVKGNREVWDTLLLGAQYGDAGIGSDAAAFRRLYPFSPALVATLVALSQALQRERTALRVMTELLVARRDTLAVNDLIGVAALFEPLVLKGELPDRPKLRQQFQAARDTYRQKLRPLLLQRNGITEEQASGHGQFELDDRLIKTLLLGALVPEVPALHNLNASRLHALNFGSITAPVAGYEGQIVVDRLTKIAADAGEIGRSEGPDPIFTLKLSSVDYDKLLDLVPHNETSTGVRQQLIRDLICDEIGVTGADGTFGELPHMREWRGRKHLITVKFGNIRDRDSMPDAALYATGESWRIVVDYPFDVAGQTRLSDLARIERLERGSHTVFWLPLFLTDELMARVGQLAKVNYLLYGDRLNTLASDWSLADRQQGKSYLRQRQQQLRTALLDSFKQAYGAAKAQSSDVETDEIPVLHSLADGLPLGDPRGGTLKAAFDNLTADLLAWSYPGTPALPVDEKPLTRAELSKVLHYARLTSTDPTHGTPVETGDRRTIQRICNNLKLGELAEHRYVLTTGNSWWSRHLVQESAKRGYTQHFPVHVLRELLDLPQPRGFDRDLQNLIIAVFALEQQLAWYKNGGIVSVGSVQEVHDDLELRQIEMPDETDWQAAVKRVKPMFGTPVPESWIPAALTEFSKIVRAEARTYAAPAAELVTVLTRHATVLGIDLDARTGRLATAKRVAKLLREIAAETDDVVLVGLIAEADVGGIGDSTAGTAFKQAVTVIQSLAATQWALLEAIVARAGHDERANVIVEQLRLVAGADEAVHDLSAALDDAVRKAAALLAAGVSTPPGNVGALPGNVGVGVPPGNSGTVPAGNGHASVPADDGGASVLIGDGGAATVVVPAPRGKSLIITQAAEAKELLDSIEAEVRDGHTVRVSWEVVA